MHTNKILISNGTLNEPGHEFHKQIVYVLVDSGVIKRLETSPFDDKTAYNIDATGCHISVGMFDLRCQLKDPGLEHQEDIESGCKAAAAGGFTGLALQPTTFPIIQSKSQVQYINAKSVSQLPLVIPVGAATQDFASEEITEMYDMKLAGARAFSNGDNAYESGGGLMRVLMYASSIGGLIMSHAQDKHLAGEGSVNESEVTIHTGLKQQAYLAETTQIQKEIEIAEYAGHPLHFSHISCAKSVEIIRAAKKKGLQITCDVAIWHLVYTDGFVLSFDANYKVSPPFRTEVDRLALIDGVNDGTIDVIITDHNPHNLENKLVEFDYASFGITGFQTFYSLYISKLHKLIPEETWWQKTVSIPRKLLGLDVPTIKVGETVDLWIADPNKKWIFNKLSNKSKSYNNPLWKQELTGKCMAVLRGDKFAHFDK